MRFSTMMISAMTLLFAIDSHLIAREEVIALDKLPKPVIDSIKRKFPESTLVSASTEKENDEVVFEVLVKQPRKATKDEPKPKPQEVEISLTAEGNISEIESRISFEQLPKPVRVASHHRFPDASFKSIESIVKIKEGKELPAVYEATLITNDKKMLEVVWAADGKVLEEEKKTANEDDEDDKQEKK